MSTGAGLAASEITPTFSGDGFTGRRVLDAIQYTRTTDKPGVFRNGIGWQEMRAGDVTYIIKDRETGLFFKNCTREPYDVWINPEQEIGGPMWVRDPEQTAVAYDWFERIA